MTLTEFHAQTVDQSCVRFLCRPLARRIASCCLLTPRSLWTRTADPRTRRRCVRAVCEEHNVGNPLIFIAILGIIINVILQWWLHRSTMLRAGELAADWDQLATAAKHDLED